MITYLLFYKTRKIIPTEYFIFLDEDKTEDDGESGKKGSSFLSNISNMVGKVANNAGTVIKDKVSGTSMIAEFNKEQEEFIKNKGSIFKNKISQKLHKPSMAGKF